MLNLTLTVPLRTLQPRHEQQAKLTGTWSHEYESREVVCPPSSLVALEFHFEDVTPTFGASKTHVTTWIPESGAAVLVPASTRLLIGDIRV